MTINNRTIIVSTIIFLFCFSAFGQQIKKEIEILSKNAEVIVTGKVKQKKSIWNENKTRIFTSVILDVDDQLKGQDNNSSIEIVYPGGEIDGIGELYTHMPSLENEEEVLLFLKKNKNETYKIFNGENGKITITNDPKTGEKVTPLKIKLETLKTQIKTYLTE